MTAQLTTAEIAHLRLVRELGWLCAVGRYNLVLSYVASSQSDVEASRTSNINILVQNIGSKDIWLHHWVQR